LPNAQVCVIELREFKEKNMNYLNRLAVAISLAVVLASAAFAGETNTPPCPIPGETNTPPCTGGLTPGDDSADQQASTQSALTEVEMLAYEAALSAIESMLTVF
jgi:hypothetical protein